MRDSAADATPGNGAACRRRRRCGFRIAASDSSGEDSTTAVAETAVGVGVYGLVTSNIVILNCCSLRNSGGSSLHCC